MLRRHNVIKTNDDKKFNFLLFHKFLLTNNIYDNVANIFYEKIEQILPVKAYATVKYSLENLKKYHKKYMCIIQVKGFNHAHHYLCFDKIENDNIYVIETYFYNKNLLSHFENPSAIILFIKVNNGVNADKIDFTSY